jgi:hypothetical protein
MKRAALLLLAVVMLQAPAHARTIRLSPPDHKVLENFSDYRQITNVSDLPPELVTCCADSNGHLANPGQKWEATDVITDKKLPHKRLIWAANKGDYYVVHYESGGYTHNYHVLVAICPQHETPVVVWHAVGDQLSDYNAFLVALDTNQLDDRLDSSH